MEFSHFSVIFVLLCWTLGCDCLPMKKLMDSLFSSTKPQHLPRFVDAEDYPVYCQPWKTHHIPVNFNGENFVEVDCFETLTEEAFDYKLRLSARKGSKVLGCPVRIPKEVYVKVLSSSVSNDRAFVQTFSGESCRNLTSATRLIHLPTRAEIGPLDSPYNLLYFRMTDKTDNLVFALQQSW